MPSSPSSVKECQKIASFPFAAIVPWYYHLELRWTETAIDSAYSEYPTAASVLESLEDPGWVAAGVDQKLQICPPVAAAVAGAAFAGLQVEGLAVEAHAS